MAELNHPLPVTASEFFRIDGHIIPEWYKHLVYAARAAVSSGVELALEPRPFVTYRKELVKELMTTRGVDVMQWPADLREEGD